MTGFYNLLVSKICEDEFVLEIPCSQQFYRLTGPENLVKRTKKTHFRWSPGVVKIASSKSAVLFKKMALL